MSHRAPIGPKKNSQSEPRVFNEFVKLVYREVPMEVIVSFLPQMFRKQNRVSGFLLSDWLCSNPTKRNPMFSPDVLAPSHASVGMAWQSGESEAEKSTSNTCAMQLNRLKSVCTLLLTHNALMKSLDTIC